MEKLSREIATMFRFGLVGLVNTGLTAGLMLLLQMTGLPYPAYTAIAYVAGVICSFSLNRWFTFGGGKDRKTVRFLRFALSSLCLVGLVQAFQLLGIEVLHQKHLIVIICGMVFYTSLGYIVNRLWVFAPSHDTTTANPAAQ